ncbi:MAG: DUF6435 family protein, partial [Chitinophagales bacterium]
MFKFFSSNPTQKLEVQYKKLLEQARDAQRAGNIKLYAILTEQAETIMQKTESFNSAKK